MKPLPNPTADTPSIGDLRNALDRLAADTVPQWGQMSADQMVWHCRRFIDLYLGDLPVSRPIRFAARLIGPIFLRKVLRSSPLETPRGIRTLPGIDASSASADPSPSFGDERELLLAGLGKIEALDGVQPHVLYGPTRAEDIEALVRHHTAHHFNQFGLLTDA